jgi:hypothetical protein
MIVLSIDPGLINGIAIFDLHADLHFATESLRSARAPANAFPSPVSLT